MFLNPFMLFGITAIGVPILIHLLNRRRFQRVTWAAMRFLRISVEQNQRRIKVEDILLLIFRCLLLILLALALARPVLQAASSALLGSGQVTAVILLDNSYSMSQTDGVESRFESAKKAAAEVIKAMPTGSSVAVLLVSDVVTPLVPEPTYDLTLATNAIKEAPLFDRSTNMLEGFRVAIETLKGRPAPRKEIYLISDGQAIGWRQISEITTLLRTTQADIRPHILFVGQPVERNLALSALRIDGGLTGINQPLRLEARIRNCGKAEAANVNVALSVDTDPPMDQQTIPSIPPGEERSISLFARLKTQGYHILTARLDPDHLPADDSRSLAVRAVKDVKVLLIEGESGREARDSEVFFLANALRPVPRSLWDDYFIKVTSKTPTELDTVRFEDFDAVISANVTDFAAPTLTQLAGYLRGGGALWVFPGDNINARFYNDQLLTRYGILPAALLATRGDARSQETSFSLAGKDYDHPIVSLWRDPAAGILSSARFFKAYQLKLDSRPLPAKDQAAPAAAPQIILNFADGSPAIVQRDYGQGRVLLFASTATTSWTDLPARAGIFIPLIHRALGYSVARQDEHLTLKVGDTFTHIAPIEMVNKDALITKRARSYSQSAKDLNEVNESRRIELTDNLPLLQFGPTNFAGPYQVKIADSAPVYFAAQSDPDESTLDALTNQQRQLLSEVASVVTWTPGISLNSTIAQARVGTELSLPLAMIALVLATLETLLAQWFSKPK